MTALLYAASNGDSQVVETLIASGADPNSKSKVCKIHINNLVVSIVVSNILCIGWQDGYDVCCV